MNAFSYTLCVLLILTWFGPRIESSAKVDEFTDRFHAIQEQLQAKRNAFLKELQTASTNKERDALANQAPDPEPFAKEALSLVLKNPDAQDSLTVLIWVISNSPMKQGRFSQTTLSAIEQVLQRHSRDSNLAPFIATLNWSIDPSNEKALRQIIRDNPSKSMQGIASYALAGLWIAQADAIELHRLRLELSERASRMNIDRSLEEDYGDATASYLRKNEPLNLRDQAQKLLSPIAEDPQHANTNTPFSNHQSLQTLSQKRLFALQHLQVGQLAPTIQGELVTGGEFTTQNLRGKKVLILFTGEWCAACRGLYPVVKELRHAASGSLELVSICSDARVEDTRLYVNQEKVLWPVIWDGSPNGPIASEWQVEGWPLVVLLDESGIIRNKFRGAPHHDMLKAVLTR